MIFYTSSTEAPWVVGKSEDRKRARLNAVRDYPDKCTDLLRWDERIVRDVQQELDVED